MRILTRYIFKEIFAHCLLGLLVFTFVLYVRPLSRVLELVARRSLHASQIAFLFLLPLPSILVITIPMAVLLGTLIGLSRMAADSEIIAIRSTGIGKAQLVWPVLMFALCGWALTAWISLFLAPSVIWKGLRRVWQPRRPATRSSHASSLNNFPTSSCT